MTLTCIAHRGGHGDKDLPENSLAAIEHSLQLGVDAIEIDLWQVNGELLVTHDRRLGKQIAGSGRLLDQTPEQIAQLRLGNGEPIPRLRQILELVGSQCPLNIEIKGPNAVPTLVDELLAYTGDCGGDLDQYIVSSFDQRQLLQIKNLLPKARRAVLIEGIPLGNASLCEPIAPYSFNLHLNFIDRELIDDTRRHGYKVWSYTANTEDDWQLLEDLGADGAFTDYPQALMAFNQQNTPAVAEMGDD